MVHTSSTPLTGYVWDVRRRQPLRLGLIVVPCLSSWSSGRPHRFERGEYYWPIPSPDESHCLAIPLLSFSWTLMVLLDTAYVQYTNDSQLYASGKFRHAIVEIPSCREWQSLASGPEQHTRIVEICCPILAGYQALLQTSVADRRCQCRDE